MKQIILYICIVLYISANAQTGAVSGTKYGVGTDSILCLQNLTLMSQYGKQKNYKMALEPWRRTFENCPKSSKNIYIYGASILGYQILNSDDFETKLRYCDTLEMMFDKRIEYGFGDRGTLLMRKATSMSRYRVKITSSGHPKEYQAALLKTLAAYKEAISQQKGKTKPNEFKIYIGMVGTLYNKSGISEEAVLEEYQFTHEMIEAGIKSNPDKVADYESVKAFSDKTITSLGILDCDGFKKLLMPKYEKLKDNPEEVVSIFKSLKQAACTEYEFFKEVANTALTLKPDYNMGRQIADVFLRQKDYENSRLYLNKILDLATEDNQRVSVLVDLAKLELLDKKYVNARKQLKEALKIDPDNGEAYLILGDVYANGAETYSSDPFKRATVYWVVVDMYQRAKAKNADLAAQVQQRVNVYSKNYPSTQDAFMRTLRAGDGYTVGGWINERTTVRLR